MSRRRPTELQFGSDSFLDVVANIVGILIILIVIAGLRVSRTPIVKRHTAKTESVVAETIPIPSSSLPDLPELIEGTPDGPRLVILEPADEPEEEPVSEPEPPPLPPLIVPRELVDTADQLESEITALKEEEEGIESQLKLSSEQQAKLLERQQEIQSTLAEKSKVVAESQQKSAKLLADIDLARQSLARLEKQVNELESIPPHVEKLEHRITPLSRVVNGKEKHYRLEFNRIAEVPIEELIESFREQIERRKDWLAKTRQHQGQIGPIRGFNMTYLVRVDNMTEMDSFRASHGGYRISLASWEIQPEPDLAGESEQAALRKGSQFYQSILGLSSDTTLTFWVYPDSYPLYRKIQKFTHAHGFSVAARPLPKGVHIAGSPNGSKSASQ